MHRHVVIDLKFVIREVEGEFSPKYIRLAFFFRHFTTTTTTIITSVVLKLR